MSVDVMRADPADLEALIDLELVCEGQDAWSPALIVEGLNGLIPTTSWFVARRDRRVIGYAVLAVVDDIAELQRIGVHPEARREGVAAALLAEIRAYARRSGAERVLLEVRESNEPARALYLRDGFVEIARRSKYYRDGATALVMEVTA